MNEIHLHFNAFGYPSRPIEVHVKNIGCDERAQIINLLNNVMTELETLTGKVNELTAKADQLQATVDSEQAQVAALIAQKDAAIADLTAQKEALQAIIDNGPTPEALNALSTQIDGTIAKLSATDADVAGTVADETNPGE